MYLLDSDVARKICQYTLVDEMAHTLGCTLVAFSVLPQLRYQLGLGTPKGLKKLGSTSAVADAVKLLGSAKEMTLGPEAANNLLKLNRPDIDSGEQTLFAALLADSAKQLFTGDKRALVALSNLDGVDHIWSAIRCFENLILLMTHSVHFPLLSNKVRGRADVDIGLSIAFGRTFTAERENVLNGLMSYLENLVEVTSGHYQIAKPGIP